MVRDIVSAADVLEALKSPTPADSAGSTFLTALQKTTAELHAIRNALDEERHGRLKDLSELSALREERHTLILFLTRISPDVRSLATSIAAEEGPSGKCLHDLINEVEQSVNADRQLLIAAHNELRAATATAHELRQEVRELRATNDTLSNIAVDSAEALRALSAVAPLLRPVVGSEKHYSHRGESGAPLALRDRSTSFPVCSGAGDSAATRDGKRRGRSDEKGGGAGARQRSRSAPRGGSAGGNNGVAAGGEACGALVFSPSPPPRLRGLRPAVQGAVQVLMQHFSDTSEGCGTAGVVTAASGSCGGGGLLATTMYVVDCSIMLKDALVASKAAAAAAAQEAKHAAAQLRDAVAAANEGERAARVANTSLQSMLKEMEGQVAASEAAVSAALRRAVTAEGLVAETSDAAQKAERAAAARIDALESERSSLSSSLRSMTEKHATAVAVSDERERKLCDAHAALSSLRQEVQSLRESLDEARGGAARSARLAEAAARKREGDLTSEVAELEGRVKAELAEHERLLRTLATSKQTIGSLESDVSRLTAELHTARCAAETATALARRSAVENEELQISQNEAVADAERLRRRLETERATADATASRLSAAEVAADELRGQVHSLQAQLADHTQRGDSAEHALGHSRQLVEEVEKMLHAEREAKARAEATIKSEEAALESARRRESELVAEIRSLRSELEACKAQARTLGEEKSRLQRLLQQAETAASAALAKAKDHEANAASASERAAHASEQAASSDRLRDIAVSDYKAEKANSEKLRRELSSALDAQKQAQVRCEDLASELVSLRATLTAVQEEATTVRTDRDSLTDAARMLRIESSRTARALESEREARMIAERRAEDSEAAAAALRETSLATERELAQCKRAIAESESERAALTEHLARAKKGHASTKEVLRGVEVRLEELESRVTSLRATEARLTEEIKGLSAERDDAVALRRSFETENDRLSRVLQAERARRRDLQTALSDAATLEHSHASHGHLHATVGGQEPTKSPTTTVAYSVGDRGHSLGGRRLSVGGFGSAVGRSHTPTRRRSWDVGCGLSREGSVHSTRPPFSRSADLLSASDGLDVEGRSAPRPSHSPHGREVGGTSAGAVASGSGSGSGDASTPPLYPTRAASPPTATPPDAATSSYKRELDSASRLDHVLEGVRSVAGLGGVGVGAVEGAADGRRVTSPSDPPHMSPASEPRAGVSLSPDGGTGDSATKALAGTAEGSSLADIASRVAALSSAVGAAASSDGDEKSPPGSGAAATGSAVGENVSEALSGRVKQLIGD